MQSLITAVRAGVHLQLWPFLKTGQRVSIEEGPLRFLEGVLITTKGSDQLILSISLLQRSVAVAVDRRWVRPLDVKAGDVKAGDVKAGDVKAGDVRAGDVSSKDVKAGVFRPGSHLPFGQERVSFSRSTTFSRSTIGR